MCPFDASDKRPVPNIFDSRRRVGPGPQRRLRVSSFIPCARQRLSTHLNFLSISHAKSSSNCRTGIPQGLGDGVPTERKASYTKGI